MGQRGRPKLESLPTRQLIIEAATDLFQETGFKKASVEKICERACVSKMSFYRSFKDKVDLIIAVFRPFVERELAWAEALLRGQSSFRTKLDALFKRRQENLHAAFTTLFLEIYPTENTQLCAFADDMQLRIDTLNLRFFKQGQDEAVISRNIKPAVFLLLIKNRNELLFNPELIVIVPKLEERFVIVNELFYCGIQGDHYAL